MDWQKFVSLGIVALTAGLFLWFKFRLRKFSFKRDTHCGCTSASHSPQRGSMVFRARRGERSQVFLKMK